MEKVCRFYSLFFFIKIFKNYNVLFIVNFKNRKLMPKFVLKEMDLLYLDEMRSSINQLMVNLESLLVSKGGTESRYGLQKLKKYNHR